MSNSKTEEEWNNREKTIAHIKEDFIAHATLEIMQDKLKVCYRTHGVNHGIMCKDLREEYMNLMMDRYKGQLFPDDSQPNNRTHTMLKYRTKA